MDFNAASILTLFIGLVLGGGTIYAIIILTGAGAGKKAEKIINDAKKEADKAKRDSILELKEESFKLKQETDREVKEKKAEIQSSEEIGGVNYVQEQCFQFISRYERMAQVSRY